MFNRASSDVFPFVFIMYFLQLVMAHRQPRRPRPHQNGCAVNYKSVTCPHILTCDHSGNGMPVHHVIKEAYLSYWREIRRRERK